MRNVRRKQVDQNRKRRRLVFLTCGILLSIYLTFSLVFGDNGLIRYFKLKSARDSLTAETILVKDHNQDIKEQIDDLKNKPEVVEEIARGYGLTKKGELIFKFNNEERGD
jgi:cell division protein FtsB